MKQRLVNLGLTVGSIAIGLILLELLVRPIYGIASPYDVIPENSSEDIRYGVYDTRGFWTWKPKFQGWFDNGVDFEGNRVTTNPDGSRVVPCHKKRAGHLPRIFLLGDSQTFGWGLSNDQTWANQLQCEIESKIPGAFEVVNLGFPGSQVDQIYARGIGQVEPVISEGDIVVISFTWNDLITYYVGEQFAHRVLKDSGLRAVQDKGLNGLYVQPIEDEPGPGAKSRQGGLLELQLSNPRKYLGEKSWRYRIYTDYGIFIPRFDSAMSFLNSMQHVSAVFRIAWLNARMLYYRLRPKGSLEKKIPDHAFPHNFLVLKALQTRLQRRGAKVFVQLLPSRVFFDDFYFSSYSAGGQAFPSQDYMGFVSKPFCDNLNLTCLNRFNELKTSSRNQHTFPIDGHYNTAGAAKIAKALYLDLFN